MTHIRLPDLPETSEITLTEGIEGKVFTLPTGTRVILEKEATALTWGAIHDMLQKMTNGDWGNVLKISADTNTEAMNNRNERARRHVVSGSYLCGEFRFTASMQAEEFEFPNTVTIAFNGEVAGPDPVREQLERARRRMRLAISQHTTTIDTSEQAVS